MDCTNTNTIMREVPQIDLFPEAAAWTEDLEDIVQTIRRNAEGLSRHHQAQYTTYKHLIKCFRIPTIIASSVAAVVSAGLFNSIAKNESLTVTCVLNLVIGVLAGVELFLGVERNMAAELAAHRAFSSLACTAAGMMRLERGNRPENAASTTDGLMAHLTMLRNSSSSAVGFVHEDAFERLRTFRRETEFRPEFRPAFNRELGRLQARRESGRYATPSATPNRMHPPAPTPARPLPVAIAGVVSKRPEALIIQAESGPQTQAPEPPEEKEAHRMLK